MTNAIELEHVSRSYGDVHAVRDVTLAVGTGEVFCLLGPNGAGKTTAVEIAEGHRVPTSGRVSVLGRDPARGERALRDRVGIVLQDTALPDDLTVGEVLEMTARWYSRPRAPEALIDLVELDAKRETRTAELSGGQRRRLDLALGLAGSPDVLFLDEPTTGFDPHARRAAWSTIRALCGGGTTVVLTTHYMDEAQALADRVGVMVGGQIIACEPPEALGGRDRAPTEIRFVLPDGLDASHLPELPGPCAVSQDPRGVLVTTHSGLAVTHALTGWALERGIALDGFTVAQPTLEDVYLALTEASTA